MDVTIMSLPKTNTNVIFDILESHDFQQNSTCWVFSKAVCIFVFAYILLPVIQLCRREDVKHPK